MVPECSTPTVLCSFLDGLLYPREVEVGSYRRPSGDLVDGSVRTLKKSFSRLLVEVNTKVYCYYR